MGRNFDNNYQGEVGMITVSFDELVAIILGAASITAIIVGGGVYYHANK